MKITKILAAMLLVLLAGQAVAQAPGTVSVRAEEGGGLTIEVTLPEALPYRVFLLDEPRRLVLDFRAIVDFDIPERRPTAISGMRSGRFDVDWTRIVADLARPLVVVSAEQKKNANNGRQSVVITLETTGIGEFARRSVRPAAQAVSTGGVQAAAADVVQRTGNEVPLIALDPGHGGIDPGAHRNGVTEKAIALEFALELRRQLLELGRFEVLLTRESDEFVSLRERVDRTRAVQAGVMVSIHANTVTRGRASGAAVYVMGSPGDDREAEATAAFENSADLVSGLAPAGTETDIVRVLTDMARVETNARSALLARELIEGLRASVGVIRSRPNRAAEFRVLRAPDVPSVLLELGFLSDAGDLADLTSPEWRALAAQGIVQALDAWVAADAEAARLARQ